MAKSVPQPAPYQTNIQYLIYVYMIKAREGFSTMPRRRQLKMRLVSIEKANLSHFLHHKYICRN